MALPGPTGTTEADPGTAGTAKPEASEKEVPLEDGPAESGENPAPGGGFWDGHLGQGHRGERGLRGKGRAGALLTAPLTPPVLALFARVLSQRRVGAQP